MRRASTSKCKRSVQGLVCLDKACVSNREGHRVLVEDKSQRHAEELQVCRFEVRQIELENPQNLEQVVQRNPVLALLHAGQIGLLDANLARQLGLSQRPLFAQLTQAAADGGHLGRTQLGFLGRQLAFLPGFWYHPAAAGGHISARRNS